MKIKKKDAKQGLLIIDAETDLLSHRSTLECVSPNSGIIFPNMFGASSERITLYLRAVHLLVKLITFDMNVFTFSYTEL